MEAKIGIDPGLAGAIVINDGRTVHFHKMTENFNEIVDILKLYRDNATCSIEKINTRPTTSNFTNIRMEPLKENFVTLKNALTSCEIPFDEVSPATWQKWHNLVLPRGKGEKGLDYSELEKIKTDIEHLNIHRRILKRVPNDTVWIDGVKWILESEELRKKARAMLCDNFQYFSKNDIGEAITEAEREIEKFKSKEKQIRKNRYKAEAQRIMDRNGIQQRATLWNCDAFLLMIYENEKG